MEKRERRVSEVVWRLRPRMKIFRREESASVKDRTESRTSAWRSMAAERTDFRLSWFSGERILLASSRVSAAVIGGEVAVVVPLSSVLRFLDKSMVAGAIEVVCVITKLNSMYLYSSISFGILVGLT
ncbi:hypothetical protein CFOL_v3_00916 [Cephalotus follicularis]|uniref:Uncharacterized protein n=1 Tax=Cephalotus follicularis TaxID=3775 RepID=A0A1Q3ANR6_CEPFO|nr:hypothetical protein CFOL_v3_00916 [Cephalotus follicularis]